MIYLPDSPALWGLLFVTGAVIGSFLNVVIYRWPRQESIISPPSHCMSCGARLTVIDLIPVVGYVLLRGRCRHCGHSYSPRYAFVELVTGLLAVGAAYSYGGSWHALLAFVVGCCLILVFFIDLDHMIIPDELVGIIMACGFGLNVYRMIVFGVEGGGQANLVTFSQSVGDRVLTAYLPASIVGICLGGGLFLFVSWFFERFFRKPVLGYGDVKLAAAMGAMLGPGLVLLAWFIVSVVVGALVAVLLMVFGIRGRREYIPFGPMLAAGGMALILFPEVGFWVISHYGG